MNKDERHHFILEQIETHEKVMVTDLASMQKVTPETIRRDLAELESNGKLTRIHGGAVPYTTAEREMIYEKEIVSPSRKKEKNRQTRSRNDSRW